MSEASAIMQDTDLQVQGAPATGDLQQVFAFSDNTFIENLHVLPNGRLLLSIMRDVDQGDVLIIDPNASQPTPKKVLSLEGSTGQTGIAPLGLGYYAVTGGIHSPFRFEQGTMSVYIIWVDPLTGTGKVYDRIPVPDTMMMNGLASIPASPHIVLSADSIGGRILRIDTKTKVVDVALKDPALGLDTDPTNFIPLGANGLRVVDNYLYFTNSALGTFARFEIDAKGSKIGEIETIVRNPKNYTQAPNAYDDFALDAKGNAYISVHPRAVNKITPAGVQTTFAGGPNSTTIKEPTSVVLGPGGKFVYIATGGTMIDGKRYGGQLLKAQI